MLSSNIFQPPNQPPFKVDLKAFYNCKNQALIQIQASDDANTTDHAPSTIVLVIDVSGSMGTAASTFDDSDGASGLSQLDIVKHATRTVLECLDEQDQIAIVAFASDVRTVVPLQPMTLKNRQKAIQAVQSLQPTSQTNLYGGLIQALELFKNKEGESMPLSNPNVMLLTDGMPNVSPPRGELQSLCNYLDANPALRQVRISTFGFGYKLKSKLLDDIASVGRSMYAFIPDSSFVGTVFVNAVSNILATATTQPMTLKLLAADGVVLEEGQTQASFQKTHWGLSMDLPPLLYGQCLELLVQTSSSDPSKEPFQAFLEWNLDSDDVSYLEASPTYVDPMDLEHTFFDRAETRNALITCIRKAGHCITTEDGLQRAQGIVNDTKHWVQEIISPGSATHEVTELKKDLDGQITEAYSRLDWYKRWGAHYLLSLARAHSLQQCSNFKDPGLQTYATQKFSRLRDVADAKFIALPPPKPSRVVRRAVTSMRTYYESSNPCFAKGLVKMSDGTTRCISQVKAGDWLQSSAGVTARVQCVVETPILSGVTGLVDLGGGVLATPWHPVRHCENKVPASWDFPCNIASPKWMPCQSLYSLVLEKGSSSFRIGDFEAVSLGHCIRDDPVASHEYLGTDCVWKDLEVMNGWSKGRIVLPADPVLRNPENGLIRGLKSNNTSVSCSQDS